MFHNIRPLPSVRLDVTGLQGIALAGDQLNPDSPPLLLYESQLLHSPADTIVGSWNTRVESYDDWRKRLEKAPHLFLQKVLLQTNNI